MNFGSQLPVISFRKSTSVSGNNFFLLLIFFSFYVVCFMFYVWLFKSGSNFAKVGQFSKVDFRQKGERFGDAGS